jgi:probable phosphoglycerate mutase
MNRPVTTLHLIRHGEVHNPRGIFYGRLPRYRLGPDGRAQAKAAAALLASEPVTAIYCSPMLRARQTAAVIAAALPGAGLRVSRRLNEVRVPLEGRPLEEGARRNWDIYTGNRPPYESPADVLARMLRFVAACRRRHAAQTVAAVTHGDPIAFLMLWAWGQAYTPSRKAPLYFDYLQTGSVITLVFPSQNASELPVVMYTANGAGQLSRLDVRPPPVID